MLPLTPSQVGVVPSSNLTRHGSANSRLELLAARLMRQSKCRAIKTSPEDAGVRREMFEYAKDVDFSGMQRGYIGRSRSLRAATRAVGHQQAEMR
jgi:hypothetical protein